MAAIQGLIMLVIFVLVLTALAPSIISNTRYNAFNSTGKDDPAGNLINASSASKSMYTLIEILFAVVGVMAVVGYGLGRQG